MRRWLVAALLCGLAVGVLAIPPGMLTTGGFRYLFRDQFTTDDAAPITSPRTCEPGPGAWAATDTENKISTEGGVLAFAGGKASPAYGDPMMRSTLSMGGGAGTAILMRVLTNSGTLCLGFGSGTASPGFRYTSSTNVNADVGSSVNAEVAATPQEFAVILRGGAGGAWHCRRTPGGPWQLQWVSASSGATNYPVISSYSSTATIDNVRVTTLSSWANEANIYTSFTATPANPQSGTMTSDGLVYVTWTPAAGETLELDVRRTDADNRWIHRCDQAGSTIKIIERNAGSETERASSAATWTAGTSYRIGVVAVGQSIKQLVNNSTKNTYTSASFNQTATGVMVSGHSTAANLYAWPRVVSIPGGV